jgi:hypothetical protein
MKTSIVLGFLFAICLSAEAQVQDSFFGMTGQISGYPGTLTVQYPLETITGLDSNFTTSPVGLLGHPTNFAWGWVELSSGACTPPATNCNWSLIDPALAAANAQGVKMILTIAWTPSWAAGTGSGNCTMKSDDGVSATLCSNAPASTGSGSPWAVFISALMYHLYNLGYPNPVKYIELWNEANTTQFWGPAADSGYGLTTLAAMAQTAYPIIHNYTSCTPNCPFVLTPSAVGAASGPVPASGSADDIVSDWIGKYLAAAYTASGNTSFYADGIAYHGYLHTTGTHAWPESYCINGGSCGNWSAGYHTCPSSSDTCFGPVDTLVANIRSAANAAGATSLPLVETEGSWGEPDLDQPTLASPYNYNLSVPLDTAWMARWLLLQAGLHATDSLVSVSWYFWDPTCKSSATQNCVTQNIGDLGYLNTSTSELIPFGVPGNNSEYGSGLGYGWLTKWLVGSTISTPCAETTTNSNVWSCTLRLANGDSAQVVWYAPTTSSTSWTTTGFTYYQDLTGCVQAISGGMITLAQQPVILMTKNETTHTGWGSNTCI